MRIPIEFTERAHPYSRRRGAAPGIRRNGVPYPGTRVRNPYWMDDPEELRQFPQTDRAEEPVEFAPVPDTAVRQDYGIPRETEPVPVPTDREADTAETENSPSGEEKTWQDRYVRLKADFENFKRHAGSEKTRVANAGKDAVLDDIFPLVDHLQRAITAAENAGGDSGILTGLEMVYREFLGVLEKHGLEKIETVGEPFDPRIHEAVAIREHPEYPEDTVVEEVRNGFMRGGNLLRPAHVIVAQ